MSSGQSPAKSNSQHDAHILAPSLEVVAKVALMVNMIGTYSISMVVSVFLIVMMVTIHGGRLGTTYSPGHHRSVQSLPTTTKIVGGQRAPEYLSFGFSAGPQLCGGTLIHDDILLTAARK